MAKGVKKRVLNEDTPIAKPLSPVRVEAVKIEAAPEVQGNDIGSYDLPPGTVLLQGIDEKGKEVGKPFTTSERTYRQVFSNTDKFVLKKKAVT